MSGTVLGRSCLSLAGNPSFDSSLPFMMSQLNHRKVEKVAQGLFEPRSP